MSTKAKRSLAAHKANWTRKLTKAMAPAMPTPPNVPPFKLPVVDYSRAEELLRRIARDLGMTIYHCQEAQLLQAENNPPLGLFHEQLEYAHDNVLELNEHVHELQELLQAPVVELAKARKGGAK